MSEFAQGAIGVMMVQAFLILAGGYCIYVYEYWRDSKLPPRPNA